MRVFLDNNFHKSYYGVIFFYFDGTYAGGIGWNGKNNHFRFSLFKSESESEKSEKITFQKRK